MTDYSLIFFNLVLDCEDRTIIDILRDAIYTYFNKNEREYQNEKNKTSNLSLDIQTNNKRTERSGINTNNISFSLDEDSQRRKLTQQQVEFFNDLKVRDEKE